MLEIVASVCLMAQPQSCKEIHLTFAEEQQVTQAQCFYYGQIELAKWSGSHPDWTIQRWKCGQTGQIAKADI